MSEILVERGRELDRIGRAVADAADGRSTLLACTGPVGIGRSALVDAAAELVGNGARVLRATAARMEQPFAGGVLRQLLEPLLHGAEDATRARWFDGDAASAREVFAHGFDAVPTAVWLHGLWSLLAAIGADRPLLVFVDDLQWADEDSLRLLAYLTNRWSGLRLAVVVTVRDGDPRAEDPLLDAILLGASALLPLAPLSRAGITALVRDEQGRAHPEFVSACLEVTGGNPLLLASTLATAGPGAESVCTGHDQPTRDRIATCLRHQPARTRALACALAVLGQQPGTREPVLCATLTARLAGLDPVGYAQAVLDVHRLGLFGQGDPPTPLHPAVTQAALSLLTVAQAQDLHERTARLLHEAGRGAEEVAAHLMRVTRCGQPWVGSVLREAAEEARRRHAFTEAASYLRRALLSAPLDGPQRARLLLDLAGTERGFAPADAELHLVQATVLLPDAVTRAGALISRSSSFLGVSGGQLADLVRSVSVELDDTARGHPQYESLKWRLQARSPSTPYGDVGATSATAVRVLGGQPPVDTPSEREELGVLLNAAAHCAAVPAARVAELGQRLIAHEPARAEHVFGVVPTVIGSLLVADSTEGLCAWLDVAQQDAQRADLPYARLLTHVEQACVLMSRGDLVLAQVHADAADRLSTPEHPPSEDLVSFALALIALGAQDRELAESVLRRRSTQLEDPLLGATQLLLQATVAAMRGEWHAALQAYQSCGRTLRAGGWRNSAVLPWAAGAITMYQRLGNREGALAVLDAEQEQVDRWASPRAIGRQLRLRAELTDGPAGIELLRESVEVLRDSPHRTEVCLSLDRLGARTGEESVRVQAHRLRRWCGLPRTAMTSQPPREDAQAEPGELTRTEHRVLTLAVGGLSNHDIAEELAVSLRAVEKHLTRSYRKLRITGRAGLAVGPDE